MSTPEHELTFVRHGQGSFFAGDYDQLSPLGRHQAGLLGHYWGRNNFRIEAVFSGPRARQTRTAQIAGERFTASGECWPEVQVIEELDEFPFQEILDLLLPPFLELHPERGPLARQLHQSQSREEALAAFKPLFENLCQAWVAGRIAHPRVESWPSFARRVRRGLQRVLALCDGSVGEKVVFTSGGPIAVAVQAALALPDHEVLPLAWRIHNSAFCRLAYATRWSLRSYNEIPHISEGEWITDI